MSYVFDFTYGFTLVLIGGALGLYIIMNGFIEEKRRELNDLNENLTKPESYIWIDCNERYPMCDGEYLVEYYFEDNVNMRFHSVHRFDAREKRFSYEGFKELKVIRWAELPK